MYLLKPLLSIIILTSALYSCENKTNIFDDTPAIKDGYVNAIIEISSGEVEKWDGGINKERAEEALREGIEYLKSLKK